MLSRNFQARVSFVSPALKLPLLQPAPRLVIPKFGRARELPPHPKSLPQPRHAKSPFYPSAGNEAPRRGVKTGGGTLVTYPTFRTSASLSLAPPPPSPPHSYTEAAKTRETPRTSVGLPTAAQPETLPRLHRPPEQLAVPHPPDRMRIRCGSRRPAGSATASSTSKELPRCSPRLSRHLNPHSAVLTCPTGTAAPSPIPPMKPRPTRRHQGGSALTAAFYLLFDLTGLPVLDTEQTWRVSIDGAVAGHIIHGVSPPCRCFLGGDFHNGTSCSCSGSRSRCGSVLAIGRAAALLLLSFVLLLCSCSRLRCCCCCTTSGSYRSCCFSTRSRCYCTTCSLLVRSLLERLLI